jgi:hypothetical protein
MLILTWSSDIEGSTVHFLASTIVQLPIDIRVHASYAEFHGHQGAVIKGRLLFLQSPVFPRHSKTRTSIDQFRGARYCTSLFDVSYRRLQELCMKKSQSDN